MDEVRHADVTTTRHVLRSTVGNQNQQIDMVMFVRGGPFRYRTRTLYGRTGFHCPRGRFELLRKFGEQQNVKLGLALFQ